MKISYAILTHNEGEYIEQVLSFLVANKQEQDEIVVVDDYSDDLRSKAILEEYEGMGHITLVKHELNNNFAEQKNYLNSLCTGDYIFQIDADEVPNPTLIESIHELLEENSSVDLFLVPRINTVEGLTQEHVRKWGWNVNSNGWVNFPDFQSRIYKNRSDIKWINKVHERIIGTKTYAFLPGEEEWCLYHHKEITRQEKQNNFYNTI